MLRYYRLDKNNKILFYTLGNLKWDKNDLSNINVSLK